jgi:hypothetical protein
MGRAASCRSSNSFRGSSTAFDCSGVGDRCCSNWHDRSQTSPIRSLPLGSNQTLAVLPDFKVAVNRFDALGLCRLHPDCWPYRSSRQRHSCPYRYPAPFGASFHCHCRSLFRQLASPGDTGGPVRFRGTTSRHNLVSQGNILCAVSTLNLIVFLKTRPRRRGEGPQGEPIVV